MLAFHRKNKATLPQRPDIDELTSEHHVGWIYYQSTHMNGKEEGGVTAVILYYKMKEKYLKLTYNHLFK